MSHKNPLEQTNDHNQDTNKGLRKAGTGDVLAGLIAGFLAQGLSPLAAVKRGCETGNTIANILTKKKKGYYFLASDIVKELAYYQKASRALRSEGLRAGR
ncbi:hypothetical protein HY414_00005 [Candidatus Kaiserbacteria bacterium]|nr:hypothetical protein [Candidatus Kaiserbacteria bacterium]